MQEPAPRPSSKAMAFGVGFGIAAVLTLALVAALSLLWARKHVADRKRGWDLVELLAATRDLDEGSVLTAADVAVKASPEMFATGSVYRPGEASKLIGQKLQVPVQVGDLLRRSNLEKPPLGPHCAQDARATAKALGVEGSPEVQRFLEALATSVAATQPPKGSAP